MEPHQSITATFPYPPSYLILFHSSSWKRYFWAWWSDVTRFGQFVVSQIDCDV